MVAKLRVVRAVDYCETVTQLIAHRHRPWQYKLAPAL